jgi:hypothetical protein
MKYMYTLLVGFLALNPLASQCNTGVIAQEASWESFKKVVAQSSADIAKNGSEVISSSAQSSIDWIAENICVTIGPVQLYRFVNSHPWMSLGTATASFVGLIYLNRWFHRNYIPKNGPINYVHKGSF